MSPSGEETNVISLVTNTLTRLGFLKTASTTLGAVEEDGLRAFQQERGLIVSGQIDEPTIRAIDEARWKLGDRILSFVPGKPLRGDDVAEVLRNGVPLAHSPPSSVAPKGRDIPAQGNALGSMVKNMPSPEGARQRLGRPFRA
jgi:peptidoglycan hydrolase-like protein with peptidoglycan-binding domain